MDMADQLISGYTAYTDAAALGASAAGEAPATTPSIITASSPECAIFSISAASGILTSVSITHGAGC
jgi:hypothetical protein